MRRSTAHITIINRQMIQRQRHPFSVQLKHKIVEVKSSANYFVGKRITDWEMWTTPKGHCIRIPIWLTSCTIQRNVMLNWWRRFYRFNNTINIFSVTARSKVYASLFQTRFGLRNRLQVNGPELKDEKIGGDHPYFSRLATEWDEYYVHELRHRKLTQKFRVKS